MRRSNVSTRLVASPNCTKSGISCEPKGVNVSARFSRTRSTNRSTGQRNVARVAEAQLT